MNPQTEEGKQPQDKMEGWTLPPHTLYSFLYLALSLPGSNFLVLGLKVYVFKYWEQRHGIPSAEIKGDFSGDDCEAMLLLYEFEVKTKINDPSLYSFLESVWEMPGIESRTLETMALLAMDKPAHYPTIAQNALRKLLVIHKNKEPVDVLKYSGCMHNLIDLLMSDGVSSTILYSLKEIWGLLKSALSLISQTEGYPEEEILWLMIKSWNIGILMYSRKKYVCAKRWAGLALDFLGHLGSLKINYEDKVNLLYVTLKEALDKKWELMSAEMTERLRALPTPPEDPGSVPSTHTTAHNNLTPLPEVPDI